MRQHAACISIDFETGSRADLKKVGAARYAEDPTTQVLCMAWKAPGFQTYVWKPGEPFPQYLKDWVKDGGKIRAFNAMFEYWIWNKVLRKQLRGIPVPELTIAQLDDTMAEAAFNGLPLSLDQCAQALPKLGVAKDKQGHRLMLRMSKPRMLGTTPDKDRWWHIEEPRKYDELCDYCKTDVEVERAIAAVLEPLPKRERAIWEVDAKANARGIYCDQHLSSNIEALAERETKELDFQMDKLTSGQVKSCRAVGQLLKYCQFFIPEIDSLSKDKLAHWIEKLTAGNHPHGSPHFHVLCLLELRQEAAKSSVAKVKAMRNFSSAHDMRMRGLYQYYGAFRTGRDAGRGPQIQNFPRPKVRDIERLVEAINNHMDSEGFQVFFGVNCLEGLSSALRSCIMAEPGKWFCSFDFSQIEARVSPWLAGDERMMDVFRQGRDIYVVAAAQIYGIPEHAVDADQRQIGKVAVLALGFGGGVGAFQNMAEVYGVEVSDERADEIKLEWRAENPLIVSTWYSLESAAIGAIKKPGATVHANHLVSFTYEPNIYDHGVLKMHLPSGRNLYYREPEIGLSKFDKDCVWYMGVNQYTRKWEKIQTYGGKFFENAVQAIARDIMKGTMLRLDRLSGVNILGPIHDEVMVELGDPALEASVALEFKRRVPWASGLPIDADGYVGKRFKK